MATFCTATSHQDYLVYMNGKFSSNVLTTGNVNSVSTFPTGISCTSIGDITWSSSAKLYLFNDLSGPVIDSQATLKTGVVHDVCYDNSDVLVSITNTAPSPDEQGFYLMSGRFTSTIKSSVTLTSSAPIGGCSYDPSAGVMYVLSVAKKLVQLSGRFSTTITDSFAVTFIGPSIASIAWDGTDTGWSGNFNGTAPNYFDKLSKLFLSSGKFSSTLKDSRNLWVPTGNPATDEIFLLSSGMDFLDRPNT